MIEAVIVMQPGQPQLQRRHLQLLALLIRHGTASGAQIAAALDASLSTASRIANRLVDLGFAGAIADRHDRRVVHFVPTRAGRSLDAQVRGRNTAARRRRMQPAPKDTDQMGTIASPRRH